MGGAVNARHSRDSGMRWNGYPHGYNGIRIDADEFMVLTATRKAETLKAGWNEIDLEARTWTIPASRMKAEREHR